MRRPSVALPNKPSQIRHRQPSHAPVACTPSPRRRWRQHRWDVPTPHRSDEYRILFCRGLHEVGNAGYYVLTVGSSQKPKYLGLPAPSACMKEVMRAGTNPGFWSTPVLHKGCLHWNQHYGSVDGVLVFDTLEESFRFMSSPNVSRALGVCLRWQECLAWGA
jgi:hypothetical protein